MIEPVDLEAIDTEYFDIIVAKDYLVVLHSRITGHDWAMLERVANNHRTFVISHRHGPGRPYHTQKNRASIAACCDYIKDHDAFHLERERQKQEKTPSAAFLALFLRIRPPSFFTCHPGHGGSCCGTNGRVT